MIRNGVPGSQIKKGDVIAFNSRDNLIHVFDAESGEIIFWDKSGQIKFIDGPAQFIMTVTILSNALGLSHKPFYSEIKGYNMAFIFE